MSEDPDIVEVSSSPESSSGPSSQPHRTRNRKRPSPKGKGKGKEKAWIDSGEVIEISSSDNDSDDGRGRVKRRRVSGPGRTEVLAQNATEGKNGWKGKGKGRERSPSFEMVDWTKGFGAGAGGGGSGGSGGAGSSGAGGTGCAGRLAAAPTSSGSTSSTAAAHTVPFPMTTHDADSPSHQNGALLPAASTAASSSSSAAPFPTPQPHHHPPPPQAQQPRPYPTPPNPTPPNGNAVNLFDPASTDDEDEDDVDDLFIRELDEVERTAEREREVYEIPSSPVLDPAPRAAQGAQQQRAGNAVAAAAGDFEDDGDGDDDDIVWDLEALQALDALEAQPPQPQLAPGPASHSAPAPAPLPTPQIAPEDIPTTALASILEIVPDVDPAHASSLITQYLEEYKDQVVQPVLHVLFESDYPKVQREGKGKKRELDGEEGGREGKRVEIDYASLDRVVEGGKVYAEMALHQLQVDFPRAPKPFLRKRLQDHNGLYAPTWISLRKNENAHRDEGAPLEYNAKQVAYVQKGKGKELYDPEFEEELRWVRAREAEETVERDKALAEKAEEEEYERNGDGIECGCCFATYPFNKITQCPETHLFCKDCITRHVESKLGDMNPVITCIDQSGCKAPLPDSELRSFLPEKLWDLYERLRAQKAVEDAGLEGLEACPFCEFKAVVELPFEEERLFRCGNAEGGCGAVTCRKCKKADHLPKSCEEAEKDKVLDGQHSVEEAMTKALMRNCPKCQKAFIKSEGCNKMTCPYCHTMSCYVCRQEVKSYDHFDQMPGGGPPRPRNGKCLLYDQVEQRHAEEVKAAAEKAMAELKAKRPDIDEKEIKVDIPKAPPAAATRPGVFGVGGGGLMQRVIGGAGAGWGLPAAVPAAGGWGADAGGWGADVGLGVGGGWGAGAGAGVGVERVPWGAGPAVPPPRARAVARAIGQPRRLARVPQPRPAVRGPGEAQGPGVIVIPPLPRAAPHAPQPNPALNIPHPAPPPPDPNAQARIEAHHRAIQGARARALALQHMQDVAGRHAAHQPQALPFPLVPPQAQAQPAQVHNAQLQAQVHNAQVQLQAQRRAIHNAQVQVQQVQQEPQPFLWGRRP